MSKPLVVVESPAKVRTIKKYLGNDYSVAATVGHIKDLPQREMGIDVESGFTPEYTTIPGKQKVIQALKTAAGTAQDVYLAPDPDREGEAIAWHTAEVLQKKGRRFHRVLFHELTKDAIQKAMAAPEELDRHKYEAQQARRILDRLVGYQVSPLLWRKVKGGLSAGRVQTVALRIICERERAIQAFVPQEYWSITAHLEGRVPPPFAAKLVKKGKEKVNIPDEPAAKRILAELRGQTFIVDKVQKKTVRKNPPPPFTTSKLQQEAIRPTSSFNMPDKVAPYLTRDQLALYQLIWQRFIASQMQEALIDQVSASIAAGPFVFTASGSAVRFPGFMALYQADEEDNGTNGEKGKEPLPDLKERDRLTLHRLEPKQHFTQPPPRFSEASLVKELEENGIGRPSTYAAILSTIRDKGYVELLKGYFRPSELGFIVNDLLVMSFADIFDVEFTARMEENLDQVESNKGNSLDLLTQFYQPFRKDLEVAAIKMVSIKGVGVPTELACPQCRKTLHIKIGKNGHFLACSGYPKCKYSSDYTRDEKGHIRAVAPPAGETTDKVCEKCGKPMVLKRGRYGDFLACSGFPACKNTQSLSINGSAKSIGVKCPQDGCSGEVLEKTSKRGKVFYGCSRYPDCSFATWDKPVSRQCPACGAQFLVERTTKKQGTLHSCLNPTCGFKERVE
jgi:DNA topoisomerase IA/ssDNA-binding Zn-finger/Zn-ribbon topoisomerase 1